MATLAESFLADLEELDDDDDVPNVPVGDAGGGGGGGELLAAVNYDNLDAVAPLVHTERYQTTLQARRERQP